MHKLLFTGFFCLFMKVSFSIDQDSLPTYNIEEVTVSATRMNTNLKSIPQKVEIIDGSIINSLPSDNIGDILKKSTNLDIIQYPGISSNIGMRGFSPSAHARSYTLLLLNGKPLGTSNFAALDASIVQRIEVVKGPYSTLYGSDAMGGVINIITKSPAKSNSGHASIEAGSYGHFKVNGMISGHLGSKSDVLLAFTRNGQQNDYRIGNNNILKFSEKDKLIIDKASYGDFMKNSGWQYNQVSGQFNFKPDEKWTTGMEVLYYNADEIDMPGNYWGSYGQSKKDIDRLNVYGNLTRKSLKNLLSFNPYFTNEQVGDYSDNSDSGFVSLSSKTREYGFKLNDNILFNKFKLLFGADLDIYDYQSERFKGKATPTNPYSPDNKNTKAALISQLTYASGGFDINGGIRYNYITYKISENDSLNTKGEKETYNAFNPSVGLMYTFPFNLKLHSSFGTGFSVPDAFKVAGSYSVSEYFPEWDFWWIKNYKGNPDLKPESSSTIEIGAGHELPGKFNADITYFYTYHRDKIVEYTTDQDTTTFKNANSSVMNGIEICASFNMGSMFKNRFKLELYSNLTYMLNNNVDETLESVSGADSVVTRHMLYVCKSNANFGIHFDNLHGFSTRIHARYMGNRLEKDNFTMLRPNITSADYYAEGGYTVKEKILQHPGFIIFDYSVSYTFSKYSFGIIVSNLFDENYTEKDGYNMPGRTVSANFKYSF